METPEPTNQAQSTNAQVTSAQEFKKRREAREQGETLTLSSGLVVRLIRPEVTKLIAKGLIPSTLVSRFMSLQGKQDNAVKADDLESILTFQRIVAVNSVIEPKVVESETPNYDENEISVDDLEDRDLEDIWVFANGGLEAVDSFRKERDAGVLPRPDSEAVPTTPSE